MTTGGRVHVRTATAADLDALAALEAASFPPPERPWSREQLEGELGHPAGKVWIALEDQGTPAVGYAAFRKTADEAELLRIATAPQARRRGVALALLEAALQDLDDSGTARCFLEVRRDNLAALALYRHQGFHEIGLRLRYYPDGGDALLLARRRPGG